ncbi:TauD/TfdA family dioxygenase [Pseudomonas caspiana]|uniref:Gamma-butyrobetaine hydroxylase n=1 Tax=Pseudomonas caspiana TaxID=1451454 RepID=A0A1Y3PGJ2_9PSED|nr:TauD/TfdA family dioxygenase [Pseudomonas caspiana]OUM75924.1 gamma-butyrobetaine hydroxylase [Pseudomonas caspiana]
MSDLTFHLSETSESIYLRTASATFEMPALWLRERSPDPTQLEALTQQRLFDSHAIDPLITVRLLETSGEDVWLGFSDGHHARYQATALFKDATEQSSFPVSEGWAGDLSLASVRADWREMDDPSALLDALDAYLRFGFIILHDVPCDPESVLVVGNKFGYVKETNFGRYFEVYSRPDGNDLAYRSIHLGPHTDNPYRDPVPGIQLLHCLINETSGGLSTLVDSVHVVSKLAQEDPEGYELLCSVPVKYRFVDKGTELVTHRPIINIDRQGRTLGVHYSPRLDGLPLLAVNTLRRFHQARKRLGELFTDPGNEIRFKLEEGELMLFDNSRVLHGRTAYDPSEGHRHLQGCYIDLDGPRERFASALKSLGRV